MSQERKCNNMVDVDDSRKKENVVWYYRSDINSRQYTPTNNLSEIKWTKYRDLEIDIIEEAYQEKKSFVILDLYRIDFDHFIEINLNDESKKQPIKRENNSSTTRCLRENRFTSMISVQSSKSYGDSDSWCPFLKAWLGSSSGTQSFIHFSKCIEKCAQGIVIEAALHDSNSNSEAAYMANKLRQYAEKSRIEISELCLFFYTKDSFLYHVLNKALREHDCSKLETLGPFCYLIRGYSLRSEDYIGTVYRGVHFTHTEIEEYKNHIGEWKIWPAYTSTSKNRQMAEMFGNTLFVIEILDIKLSAARARDISHLSSYPHEQEVLMPAGVSFQISKVERDNNQKYIIHVTA